MNADKRRLNFKRISFVGKFLFFVSLIVFVGCQKNGVQSQTANAPTALREVPALRLNYRFEPDVPAPTVNQPAQTDERNAAVQNDFDQNRAEEILDKTLTAPDKQRVLAVYHRTADLPSEFRLDMYSADGKLLRKITYDGMAVHFADTIVWSPDSATVAFVAMIRANQPNPEPAQTGNQINANQNSEANAAGENTNADAGNANIAPVQTPAVEAPKAVLTFRTEQIYICNRDGAELKPVTQNEGLIYFYFHWSPDSSALVALAAMYQEWNFLQAQADGKGELFTPQGRPRLVEKTGRERRLDDNLTAVRPVWSPDSAKIAAAFDKQVRIYDAIGDQPTQAAIPLRNQLLISSKAFDDNLRRQEQGENANVPEANQTTATLPDENSLVSFNPIISLEWTADDLLYLQTGYIKQMKNEADSARSYLRWHRLVFSPQAGVRDEK
ncbi:MAG: TolB family protein [Pyrinomonadaceae bacterium]